MPTVALENPERTRSPPPNNLLVDLIGRIVRSSSPAGDRLFRSNEL
jgi:hypothetical protein